LTTSSGSRYIEIAAWTKRRPVAAAARRGRALRTEWSNEMKRLAIIRGGVAIALMLGIVVAVAASAEASPSGQLGAYMREGLSLEQAQVALATQAQVEAAELPVRLEKALGASFAGMWFEPSKGKFCVGVVSSASRRAAEQVVAQTGLADVVSYVSVHSTWAELISAQGEWGIKLGHLGEQQSSTGLTASHNAVSVTLSSSVPEHERALLEREAAGSHVNVSITVVPPEELVARPLNSKCEVKPRENYAFCSKPLAAGVLITPNLERKPYCTAGALALLANPATLAAELETFLITAGHCTRGTTRWFTATHPGNELSEIGPTVQTVFGLPGDYGDIEVGPNWLEAGVTPALAQITNYQDNGLREARNVIGEAASVEGASFCKQGATSAEQCGTITGLNQLEVFQELPDVLTHVEGLVKTNSCAEGGDSGGPFHTLPTGNSVRILGTLVGGIPQACRGVLFCPVRECKIFYEPIKTSLEGLRLALLTTFNQTRHLAARHPLFLTESGNELLFTGEGGAATLRGVGGVILCEKVLIHGWILPKSPLVHRVRLLFHTKCELHTAISLEPCVEPIHAHLGLGELGLVLGNKTVGLLIEPSEGAPEFFTVKCGINEIKVEGAVIGEIPEKIGVVNQYNNPLAEITTVFESENKNSTKQATTSIELLGVNMTGVHLSTKGFFAGEASQEMALVFKGDGKIEICTKEPQNCP
jgi:streptogrisin C